MKQSQKHTQGTCSCDPCARIACCQSFRLVKLADQNLITSHLQIEALTGVMDAEHAKHCDSPFSSRREVVIGEIAVFL